MGIRQRAEKQINRHVLARALGRIAQAQMAILHGKVLGRRDHVNVVGLHPGPAMYLSHGHRSRALKDLGKNALVRGREMHDDYECHATLWGHRSKKTLQSYEPASRAT